MKLHALLGRFLAALVVVLGMGRAAEAQLNTPATPAQLVAQFLIDLPTNGVGQITADTLRNDLNYIVNSMSYLLQAGSPGQLLVGNASGILSPVTMTGSCSLSSAGVITCPVSSPHVVTNTYTASPSDCVGGITTGGSAFYQIGIPAASTSGFAGCILRIANLDAGAGKCVTVSSGLQQLVMPLQNIELTNFGGSVWQMTKGPGKYLLSANTTVNVDPSHGSDAACQADGLVAPYASVNNALYQVSGFWDFGFTYSATVKLCASCVDNVQIHYPSHGSPIGSQGRAAITVDCNNGTLNGAAPSLAMFFGGSILEVQNCTINNGMTVTEGAEAIFLGGNTFGTATGQAIFSCAISGIIKFQNNFTITGGATYLFQSSGAGCYIAPTSSITAAFNQDTTFTVTAYVNNAYDALAGITWNLNGHTITGTKYQVQVNGVLEGSASIPGSISGGTATQGQAL